MVSEVQTQSAIRREMNALAVRHQGTAALPYSAYATIGEIERPTRRARAARVQERRAQQRHQAQTAAQEDAVARMLEHAGHGPVPHTR